MCSTTYTPLVTISTPYATNFRLGLQWTLRGLLRVTVDPARGEANIAVSARLGVEAKSWDATSPWVGHVDGRHLLHVLSHSGTLNRSIPLMD